MVVVNVYGKDKKSRKYVLFKQGVHMCNSTLTTFELEGSYFHFWLTNNRTEKLSFCSPTIYLCVIYIQLQRIILGARPR